MASVSRTRFGQVVIGPPGSGKTTYCRYMQQFLQAQGRRVIVVNLDPANDTRPSTPLHDPHSHSPSSKTSVDPEGDPPTSNPEVGSGGDPPTSNPKVDPSDGAPPSNPKEDTSDERPPSNPEADPAEEVPPFAPEVDSADLITPADVMEELQLGPNGALVYCMQFLETNFQLVLDRLDQYPDHYVLFDFPGQIELYTHDNSVPKIIKRLEQRDFRLVAVNLVDAHHCSDPGKFISMLLTCLTTMLHLALPHVNVLSKLDLAERHGRLQFGLEFYTEVLDLEQLVDLLDEDPFLARYRRLSRGLAELVERYGLVTFSPLAVTDGDMMARLCQQLDRVGGCVFHTADAGTTVQKLLSCAVGAEFQHDKLGRAADTYIQTDIPPPRSQ